MPRGRRAQAAAVDDWGIPLGDAEDFVPAPAPPGDDRPDYSGWVGDYGPPHTRRSVGGDDDPRQSGPSAANAEEDEAALDEAFLTELAAEGDALDAGAD